MAANMAQIEKRLSSVEAALTEVQQKLKLAPPPANWVEQVSGSLADIPEEDYQLFLECCRSIRNGDPATEVEEQGP